MQISVLLVLVLILILILLVFLVLVLILLILLVLILLVLLILLILVLFHFLNFLPARNEMKSAGDSPPRRKASVQIRDCPERNRIIRFFPKRIKEGGEISLFDWFCSRRKD